MGVSCIVCIACIIVCIIVCIVILSCISKLPVSYCWFEMHLAAVNMWLLEWLGSGWILLYRVLRYVKYLLLLHGFLVQCNNILHCQLHRWKKFSSFESLWGKEISVRIFSWENSAASQHSALRNNWKQSRIALTILLFTLMLNENCTVTN